MSGRKFMQTIAEAKLFGIQLEPGGEWIRYHHLFQELLRNHLQRKSDPQDIATLHRHAAQWFGEQGLIEEGLKHAQAASRRSPQYAYPVSSGIAFSFSAFR